MKIFMGPSLRQRIKGRQKKRGEWHKWFAWRPVRVECCGVWLETIERRIPIPDGWCSYFTEYREIKDDQFGKPETVR